MIKLYDHGAYLIQGKLYEDTPEASAVIKKETGLDCPAKETAKAGTMAYGILQNHNTSGDPEQLKIKFDCLISHDITYVGIIQTARASGLEKFPIPYVLTNCHNSLCAVGGTINEDDHMFGLTCAQKFGGIYVPPHQAVIHQYAREMMAGCGRMILGSDSHTRYGALGTMAIGEGGGELAKQLLGRTYDVKRPDVIAVYLTGKPEAGVGPQDVALTLIGATFNNGYVNNKVLEFIGPGVANLSTDYRIGIDVMTTETTCLSSIWTTDTNTKDFLALHGRLDAYKELQPEPVAYYDGVVEIDLSTVKPTIAMPFHPSNTYEIETLKENLDDILADVEKRARVSFGDKCNFTLRNKVKDGELHVDQGIIAGCAGGGFENICAATDILRGQSTGNGKFSLGVYPASTPVYLELIRNGSVADLMSAGAVVKTAFCGPCFGADATPANGGLSIRHSTRNFPNREGSKVQNGQLSAVALMDARSIAATAANQGVLTAATEMQNVTYSGKLYHFDKSIYDHVVYDSKGEAHPEVEIQFGPNIKDWPSMIALTDNLLLRIASEIHDPVTTTDELIPSGETSSYRSNPLGLAEFALSRKDPQYVGRAKAVRAVETDRQNGIMPDTQADEAYVNAMNTLKKEIPGFDMAATGIGSSIYAVKPGDGSAREQAASCQKVLGGWANIAKSYATKRYRSNLINWGMVPFLYEEDEIPFALNDFIYIPEIRKAIADKVSEIPAYVVKNDALVPFTLKLGDLTDDERQIILKGCLINYYRG